MKTSSTFANEWRDEKGRFAEKGYVAADGGLVDIGDLDGELVEKATIAELVEAYDLYDNEYGPVKMNDGASLYALPGEYAHQVRYVTLSEEEDGTHLEIYDDFYDVADDIDISAQVDDIHQEFLRQAERTIVFHGTGDQDSFDSIKEGGLGTRNETRAPGWNNSVGSAVFTTSNEQVAYEYGADTFVFEIDLPQAIADGVITTDNLSREPGIDEAEALSGVAYGFNDHYYNAYDGFSGTGIDPATIIISTDIPPKYLKPYGNAESLTVESSVSFLGGMNPNAPVASATSVQFANPWRDEIGRFAPKGYQIGFFNNASRVVSGVPISEWEKDYDTIRKKLGIWTDDIENHYGFMGGNAALRLKEGPDEELIDDLNALGDELSGSYRRSTQISDERRPEVLAEIETLRERVEAAYTEDFVEEFQVPEPDEVSWTRDGDDLVLDGKPVRLVGGTSLPDAKVATIMSSANRAIESDPYLADVPVDIKLVPIKAPNTLAFVETNRYGSAGSTEWRTIHLHENYATSDAWTDGRTSEDRHDLRMASSNLVENLRFTVQHEMAHVSQFEQARNMEGREIDTRLLRAAQTAGITHKSSPLLSAYGHTSTLEAGAEAFAEWANTGGTTNNPVVQAYAKEFGWTAADSADTTEFTIERPEAYGDGIIPHVPIDDIAVVVDTFDGPEYQMVGGTLVAPDTMTFANTWRDELGRFAPKGYQHGPAAVGLTAGVGRGEGWDIRDGEYVVSARDRDGNVVWSDDPNLSVFFTSGMRKYRNAIEVANMMDDEDAHALVTELEDIQFDDLDSWLFLSTSNYVRDSGLATTEGLSMAAAFQIAAWRQASSTAEIGSWDDADTVSKLLGAGNISEAQEAITVLYGITPQSGFIAAVNNGWATSSTSYSSLALQLHASGGSRHQLSWLGEKSGDHVLDKAGRLSVQMRNSFSAASSAYQERSMMTMEALGVGDRMELWRGVRNMSDFAQNGMVNTNPLSSWSTMYGVAKGFAAEWSNSGAVYGQKIDPWGGKVFSFGDTTSLGAHGEWEVVMKQTDGPFRPGATVGTEGGKFPTSPPDIVELVADAEPVVVHVDAVDPDWLDNWEQPVDFDGEEEADRAEWWAKVVEGRMAGDRRPPSELAVHGSVAFANTWRDEIGRFAPKGYQPSISGSDLAGMTIDGEHGRITFEANGDGTYRLLYDIEQSATMDGADVEMNVAVELDEDGDIVTIEAVLASNTTSRDYKDSDVEEVVLLLEEKFTKAGAELMAPDYRERPMLNPDFDEIDAQPIPDDEDFAATLVHELYGFEHRGERYRFDIHAASKGWVEFDIVDDHGVIVAEVERNIDNPRNVMRNEMFFMADEFQNQGIGTKFLDGFEAAVHERYDIETVSLKAVSAGRYVWASRGFEKVGGFDSTAEGWLESMRDHVSSDSGKLSKLDVIEDGWRNYGERVYPGELIGVDRDAAHDVLTSADPWHGQRHVGSSFYTNWEKEFLSRPEDVTVPRGQDRPEQIPGQRELFVSSTMSGGVAFANTWRDEMGRFAEKGYIAAGVASTDMEEALQYPSDAVLAAVSDYYEDPSMISHGEAVSAVMEQMGTDDDEDAALVVQALYDRHSVGASSDVYLNEISEFYGIERQTAIDTIVESAQKQVDESALSTRMTEESLASVIFGEDDRLKTQFETGDSGGRLDFAARQEAEFSLYGTDPFQTNVEERPIYGYFDVKGTNNSFDGSSRALDSYGQVRVEFHDSVRDRTTVTFEDSLGKKLMPAPARQVHVDAVLRSGSDNIHNPSFGSPYVEAQMHGGVSAADISRVVFPVQSDKPGAPAWSPPSQSVVDRLWELGIPVWGTDGNPIDSGQVRGQGRLPGVLSLASDAGDVWYVSSDGATITYAGLDDQGRPVGYITRDGRVYDENLIIVLVAHGGPWVPVSEAGSASFTMSGSVQFANPWRDELGRFAKKGYQFTPSQIRDYEVLRREGVSEADALEQIGPPAESSEIPFNELRAGAYYKPEQYPSITSEDEKMLSAATSRWAWPDGFARNGELPHVEMERAAARAARGLEVEATKDSVHGIGLMKGMGEAPRSDVPMYRGLSGGFEERQQRALASVTKDLDLVREAYLPPRSEGAGGALLRFEPGTPYREAFGGSFGQIEEGIVSGRFKWTQIEPQTEAEWDAVSNRDGSMKEFWSGEYLGPLMDGDDVSLTIEDSVSDIVALSNPWRDEMGRFAEKGYVAATDAEFDEAYDTADPVPIYEKAGIDQTVMLASDFGEGSHEASWAHATYTLGGSDAMNKYLRGQDLPPYFQEKHAEESAILKQAILESEPTKHDLIVYRGLERMSLSSMAGERWQDDGFISTSLDRRVAESFGDVIEIRLPAGSKAIAGNWGEFEVILAPGTQFDVDFDGGMNVV